MRIKIDKADNRQLAVPIQWHDSAWQPRVTILPHPQFATHQSSSPERIEVPIPFHRDSSRLFSIRGAGRQARRGHVLSEGTLPKILPAAIPPRLNFRALNSDPSLMKSKPSRNRRFRLGFTLVELL